jgi:hypothetical protein
MNTERIFNNLSSMIVVGNIFLIIYKREQAEITSYQSIILCKRNQVSINEQLLFFAV